MASSREICGGIVTTAAGVCPPGRTRCPDSTVWCMVYVIQDHRRDPRPGVNMQSPLVWFITNKVHGGLEQSIRVQ